MPRPSRPHFLSVFWLRLSHHLSIYLSWSVFPPFLIVATFFLKFALSVSHLSRICPPCLRSCLLWCSRSGFGRNIPLTVSLSLGSVAWTPVTSGQNSEGNILNLRRHVSREIQKRRDVTASDQLNGETVSSQETKSLPKKFSLTFFFCFVLFAYLIHKICTDSVQISVDI